MLHVPDVANVMCVTNVTLVTNVTEVSTNQVRPEFGVTVLSILKFSF
jgi:hypothetical protein